jgi:hypothetical protein
MDTAFSTASKVASLNGSSGERFRSFRELHSIHPDPDHVPVVDLRRQVGHPGRHEIEDARTRGNELAVDLCQRGDRRVVDVRDEARLPVEVLVGRLVEALEQLARERRHGEGHLDGAPHRGRGDVRSTPIATLPNQLKAYASARDILHR